MKLSKLCLLTAIFVLSLSLLLSCGDNAADPHPEGCTCEECLADDSANNPEKDDTPPADGENGDTPPADSENGDTGITHTFLRSDYSMLGSFMYPAFFVNKHDMKWLDDYINNHEGLGEEAREKLLDYIAGLPDDFLDHSFMYITLFDPTPLEEDSFRVIMEDGNLHTRYIVKEEYSRLKIEDIYRLLYSGESLLIITADKDLYYRGIKFIDEFRQLKIRDTASITLEGNTKNSALVGKDVEHSLLCSTHDIKNPYNDQGDYYYTVLGKGYHSDISNVDSWGFSPVIGSLEELGTMLSALGIESTAQEELEALGLTDQIFDDKVLIPFATRLANSEIGSYNLLSNVCRVNDEGVLELELEADIDYSPNPMTYVGNPYAVRITYVVIDRSVIEGVIGINETLIAFNFRFAW